MPVWRNIANPPLVQCWAYCGAPENEMNNVGNRESKTEETPAKLCCAVWCVQVDARSFGRKRVVQRWHYLEHEV